MKSRLSALHSLRGSLALALILAALVVSGCETSEGVDVSIPEVEIDVDVPDVEVDVDVPDVEIDVDVPDVEVDVDIPGVEVTVDIPGIEVNVDIPDVEIDIGAREVIRGSGNVISEERSVSGFDRVVLIGAGDVIITQGEGEALTVEADDNLMAYIETKVKNGKLLLGFTDDAKGTSIRPSERIKFNLTARDIVGLDLLGAGNINVSSLQTDRLEVLLNGAGNVGIGSLTAQELVVHLNGAGDVKVAGQVVEQGLFLNGAGDYHAGGLESQAAIVEVNGMGNVTVWATDTLNVRISGAGTVEYYGDPQVNKNISMVGRLVRLSNP